MTNINKLLIAVSVIATNMVAIESLSVDDVRFDDGRQQESLTIDEKVDFGRNKERQTSTYLEKVISGEIGAIYSTNSNTKKTSVAMVLRYEDLFYEFIRLKLEYRYTHLNFEKKLVRRDNAPANLPSSKTVKETHSSSDLREAYINLDMGKYADISIGRQVIVWGQFELLSPMDMLLPTDYSARTVGLLKAQNRLPQDSVVLNLYPTSKIKLSTYYFPQITRDPLLQELFDRDVIYTNDGRQEIDQPDKDDEPQKAIKATYFGDSFTFGVLYYDGWEDGYTELEYLVLKDRERPDQDLDYDERYIVRKVKATGFELAIPKNRWTWKIEATQQKDTIEFDPMDLNNYDIATGERRDFLHWIVNENGGRNFVPVWRNWMAIGFDYNSKKWQTNFIVLNVGEDIIGSENKRRMKQNFALTNEDEDISYNDVYREPVKYQLPAIHTARYFDKDKNTALGAGLGIVGEGYKFFTYFTSTIGDSFSYGVSLEALDVETDRKLADDEYDVEVFQQLTRVFGVYKF